MNTLFQTKRKMDRIMASDTSITLVSLFHLRKQINLDEQVGNPRRQRKATPMTPCLLLGQTGRD